MPTGPSRRQAIASTNRRIGIVSTYPPKLCGLATFASALETALVRGGDHVDIVRIDDGDDDGAVSTRATLVNGSAASVRHAAAVLSRSEVAIIQHEYGIFGGTDGDEVLDLLTALEVPSIVVLHTVPLVPTPHQAEVLERVCALAGKVVVMTETARTRLLAGYTVDATNVVTIPHGAASPPVVGPLDARSRTRTRPQLLTWGLLGPGKGIEHAIDAMALLRDITPRVRYTIAGVTHPKVLARDGDEYRQSLIRRAWVKGVASTVTFDDTYRNVAELTTFVASSSIVVLPYDSRDQVTSGVLVDAVAAGRPVIATAFPHAVELLADGAGIVVPHGDPEALAVAIRSAVTDPAYLAEMAAAAQRIAPSLLWGAVAAQYGALCDDLVRLDTVVGL